MSSHKKLPGPAGQVWAAARRCHQAAGSSAHYAALSRGGSTRMRLAQGKHGRACLRLACIAWPHNWPPTLRPAQRHNVVSHMQSSNSQLAPTRHGPRLWTSITPKYCVPKYLLKLEV